VFKGPLRYGGRVRRGGETPHVGCRNLNTAFIDYTKQVSKRYLTAYEIIFIIFIIKYYSSESVQVVCCPLLHKSAVTSINYYTVLRHMVCYERSRFFKKTPRK